ncbi:D-alanyl-D-alanine carboxypeptidase/D-alanyl-D-alanine-endopeptidase [Salinisphaera sp. Q1T1-3]|uniref:D-alanyl-D-alanine carboxypeptidase/D-alanyl-D-alanine endopeptidase n=1 Tax=Salinisphaera sp. Q1T1-3 TaxID=2321229 RepID=UPI000E7203D0|nr:D-alanyl-D-alanine carboxypeptidase/D-alanyl-D-alanine-endopeptidase [Salinisphaera sp. Q1T1-3]RJS92339.1 D-alanyl-D-alanine carboxypeptidase/D-alanyl-D-alanine-endopeptidase [Salinisphaera sp. Q1T1-3]
MTAVVLAKSLWRQTTRGSARLGPLFVLWLASFGAVAAPADLSNLRNLASHAQVSAMVVRLSDRATIASLNPDQRLTPASVSKLFSASAALQQLGPDHRFTSRFASHGLVRGNTLDGDLVFVGGGDPSLDNKHLRELVARLQARGVHSVTGDLIVDDGLWGTVPCLTQDRCNAKTRASHAYSAPLSSAGVNFGTVTASLYPGAHSGATVQVALHPADLPGYDIDNQVRTVSRDGKAGVMAWRTYANGRSTLHLRGTLPVGYGPYDLQRAVTGAADETARVLSALLANAGVHVQGRVRTRSSDVDSEGATLATVESSSLAEQLIPMLAYSNNYMADALTLDVAADSGYNLPLTLPRAAQSLEALSERANQFAYPQLKRGGADFTSGSGLSLGNNLSARDLVSLLDYMFHQNALFPSFYGAIPVPLSAPSRTLKQGDFDFQTRIVAKTGTLSEPVTVRALAGYMRLSDGSFAAFGIVINGTRQDPALSYQQTVTAYQHDLENILANY